MATKTLYVGNLPHTFTDTQLTSHFAKYNPSNVHIMEGRGFGFVDVDETFLETAIADHNKTLLEGRTLTVNEARPRGESRGSERWPVSNK